MTLFETICSAVLVLLPCLKNKRPQLRIPRLKIDSAMSVVISEK